MEINDSGRLKHQRLHKAVASEYESSLAKAQHIKSPKQDQTSAHSINEDTIIKGEIIDLRFQDVKIRLEPSGQVITAKVSSDVPLSIGQMAKFVVSDKTGDQISLRFISSDIAPINDLIYKALSSSGLAASERNLNIVQELLKYNMPVDKGTLSSIIKLSSTYPHTDITALILMHKNNLPINTNSIAQFEAYQAGSHQILTDLSSLADIITNLLFNETNNSALTSNTEFSNTELTNNPINQESNQHSDDIITPNDILVSDDRLMGSANMTDDFLSLNKEILNLIRGGENKTIEKEYLPDSQLKYIFTDKELIQLQDHLNLESMPDSMTLKELYTFVNDLHNKGYDFTPITNNNNLSAHLFDAFIGMSSHMSSPDKEKLIALLQTDTYQSIINDALVNRWTLSTKDLTTPNRVTEYFKRLNDDLEKLQKISTQSKQSDFENVKSSVNKLQDNLQFMRDLNDLFLYVQLPMRLLEQDAHGDLYVFSKKKAFDLTDQVSVLLHLDMANLGPLDIHMTMKERYVQAVFYLEEESENIIKEHLNELIDLLSKKGYNLQAKTQVSASKPDFITDILEQDVKELSIYRHSFDTRA